MRTSCSCITMNSAGIARIQNGVGSEEREAETEQLSGFLAPSCNGRGGCAISTAERQTVLSKNLLLCPALLKQNPNRATEHLQSDCCCYKTTAWLIPALPRAYQSPMLDTDLCQHTLKPDCSEQPNTAMLSFKVMVTCDTA